MSAKSGRPRVAKLPPLPPLPPLPSKPACWRWKVPTDADLERKIEELRQNRIKVWGGEERALKKSGRGPLEEEARWYLMQDFQRGRCAICSHCPRSGPCLVLDHDHVTGLIRGYLCRSCNTGEGCGWGGEFDLYRERNPASICGYRKRHWSVPHVLPPGFTMPPLGEPLPFPR